MRLPDYIKKSPWIAFVRLYDQAHRKTFGAPPLYLCRVTPQVYVGGQQYKRALATFRRRGITAVVNMREGHHDDARKGAAPTHYLHLPTADHNPPSLDDLQAGAAFIAKQVAAGGAVYIHCGVGVGRAPTMGAAYLVSTGYSVEDAIRAIRKVRPFIWINSAQRAQLDAFAAALRVGDQP